MAQSYLKIAAVAALSAAGLLAPTVMPGAGAGLGNWFGGLVLLMASGLVFWWTFRPSADAPERAGARQIRADLPIRELFVSLGPGTQASDDAAHRLGGLLLEKLRRGELTAWGREVGASSGLQRIEPQFWQRADWTYWFLPDTPRARDMAHAALPDGVRQYRDIHFSTGETERLELPTI